MAFAAAFRTAGAIGSAAARAGQAAAAIGRGAAGAAGAAARGGAMVARGVTQVGRNVGTNLKRATGFSRTGNTTQRPLLQGVFRPTTQAGRAAGQGASPFTRGSTQGIRQGSAKGASQTAGAMSRAGGGAKGAQAARTASQRAGGGAKGAGKAGGKGATWTSRGEQLFTWGGGFVGAAGLIAPLFKNPLAGMENLLNPANWQQDLSWLAGLLNPANFKQDFQWLENLLSNTSSDAKTIFSEIAGAMGMVGRGLETGFRDVETGVKDAIWGVEEAFKWSPYILGAVAILWIYSSVK